MIFQTLDDKKECVGIYLDNNLHFGFIPENLSKTWSYSPYLKGLDIEYAQLYVDGKKIDEIVPEHLKSEWVSITKKMKSFINSFLQAKVSLEENCFFELTPKNFLIEYCEIKNKITKYVLETYSKPKQYLFYKRFNELLEDISSRELNIDFDQMKQNIEKDKDLVVYRKLLDSNTKISYNIFGSITGRISTVKNSFPIQNFPKQFRNTLKPKNDWFITLDINGAELRTSIGLVGGNQPQEDIYDMLGKDVFASKYNRKEVKEAIISWLYGSSNNLANNYNNKLDSIFNKNKLKQYWDGKYVNTIFDRKIESDEYHSISYLNQSTFIDLFHRQIIKVDDYLQNKKSFISFLLHDECVLDVTDDEKNNIIDIINIIRDTQFGNFLVNVKAGKDFGQMKKLNIKV